MRNNQSSGKPAPTADSGNAPYLVLLVVLAAVCCSLPLVIGALIALGAVSWFAVHGSTVGATSAGFAAMIVIWSWHRRRRR